MKFYPERLLKLADYLQTVPRRSFDFRMWQTTPQTGPEGDKPGECGFSGCAVGWAVHGKLFRGLKFIPRLEEKTPEIYYRSRNGSAYTGFMAAAELFGISVSEAKDLFSPWSQSYPTTTPTPHAVAKEIRKFVKNNTKAIVK